MPQSPQLLAALLCVALAGPALAEPADALLAEADALAARDGIPADPLVKKIREGQAKGIPPPRIRGAVMQLHDRLVEGKALCGAPPEALCITAAADALATGAEAQALGSMIAHANRGERARAFVAVATLQARGVDRAEAIGAVTSALVDGRLDGLLEPPAGGLGPSGLPAPPATGRGGELPVNNPTHDRDQSGSGKHWGKSRAAAAQAQSPGRGKPTDTPGGGNGNGNGQN